MKRMLKVCPVLVGLLLFTLHAHAKTKLTPDEQISYAWGYMSGEQSLETVDKLNLRAFYSGFRAGHRGSKPLMSEGEMSQVLNAYLEQKDAEAQAKLDAQGAVNQAEAAAFLASNKTKQGVVTTSSGLQYKVLKQGRGGSPKATDTVMVHYEGRLINGEVFDNSYSRGQLDSFPLNDVIDGWTEALQLMNKGAKYELYIPPELGYGESGNINIPPNSLLIFTVELVDFKP